MNSGKVFVGVLAGLAAGAALGVLFAPEKGSKLRKLIARKTDDMMEEMNEKIDEKFNMILDVVSDSLKK